MSFEGYLRANTEIIVTIGPFPDVGDGFTPQVDITLGANEAEIIKHNSTSVVDISGATWAAVTNCRGYYSLTITTSLSDTEGLLTVIVQDDSDCLPVRNSFMVMSEAAWDSMFVAKDDGFMDVNIKTIGRTDTQEAEATNLESACSNYSVTRGLAGTAVPAAVADAAGGLPISDAGGLDMDTKLANTNEITAARMGALTDWIDGGRLDLLLDAIPTTAMRGTDNAALASVVGALDDAAAAGDPTTADTLMKYSKQLINVLVGTTGIAAFPAEQAPANDINLAEVIRAIHADVTGLNGSAMVGTNSAATAAKLLAYIQLLARSDAAIATDNATELTAINADGGSGGGDFSNQTEAVEAIRDHIGDGTNLSEAGGDGDHLTAINLPNQTMDITGNLSGSVGSLTGHTNQTADNNTILAHADYGLAQLVRSTTPANKLDVSATGEAGLDFANIKDATGAHTLTNVTVPTVTTTGTCTTNTDLVTAAAIKTAIEAAGSDLDYLMISLVNKEVITKANGNVEQFNDADGSIGTIAGAITSDATTVTRLRMVQ